MKTDDNDTRSLTDEETQTLHNLGLDLITKMHDLIHDPALADVPIQARLHYIVQIPIKVAAAFFVRINKKEVPREEVCRHFLGICTHHIASTVTEPPDRDDNLEEIHDQFND